MRNSIILKGHLSDIARHRANITRHLAMFARHPKAGAVL